MSAKRALIYLHPGDLNVVSWLLTDENGVNIGGAEKGLWHECKEAILNYPLDVIVPGEDVTLTAVELPKMTKNELQQALPFALEEKIVGNIEELHFAIGKAQEAHTPVAVVAKKKMEAWLTLFHQFELTPRAFIPAMLALPPTWLICVLETICLLRTDTYQGYSFDKINLDTFITLLLRTTVVKPACITIYNFSSCNIASKVIPMQSLSPEKPLLAYMHEWLQKYPAINLIQGPYRIKSSHRNVTKLWRFAAILCAIWITLGFTQQLVTYLLLRQGTAQSEQIITAIYKRHFPQATSLIAPQERMEAKLKTLSTHQENQTIFTLLTILGKNIQNTPTKILNFEFEHQNLRLTLMTPSFDRLDDFMRALHQDGLNVKRESASMVTNAVKAHLIVSPRPV